MKAVQIEGEQLLWRDYSDPEMGANDVLIEVYATAVNRADLVQRAGFYPPPPGASEIMGLECAGVIVAVGANAKRFKVGDQVCALLSGGGYAEKVAVAEQQVAPLPKGMSLENAAAIVEVFATAYLNLYMEAAMQPGEKALLHAGASGVGTAGIQLCKALGNPVFVTAGSSDKIAQCIALGADSGANRHEQDLQEAITTWAPEGVNVVLDPVGAAYLQQNMATMALGGRLVVIGLMGGAEASLNVGLMMIKRFRLIGSTLRARPISEKAAVMRALETTVWPLFESGVISPIVDTVFPIDQADAAHKLVSSNETFGKVVLKVR